jgi:hypothetical protein
MKLLTESFQRKLIISDFKKWFINSINGFLQKNNIQIKDNNISILAGERELWAEIDGLNPSTKQIETEKIINIDKLDIFVPVGRERETRVDTLVSDDTVPIRRLKRSIIA